MYLMVWRNMKCTKVWEIDHFLANEIKKNLVQSVFHHFTLILTLKNIDHTHQKSILNQWCIQSGILAHSYKYGRL